MLEKPPESEEILQDKEEAPTSWARSFATSIFKIVTSNGFLAVVGIAITLTGLAFVPIPTVIVGLTAIVIGIIIDTVQTSTIRNIKIENSRLVKHNVAYKEQVLILSKYPELAQHPDLEKIFKLHKNATKEDSARQEDRYPIPNTPNTHLESWGRAFLRNSLNLATALLNVVITHNPTSIVKLSIALSLFAREGGKQTSIREKQNEFLRNINLENKQPHSPTYSNLTELAEATRKQTVQTKALFLLINDPQYTLCPSDQLPNKFAQKIADVEKSEKAATSYIGFNNMAKVGGKFFVKAHHPFSKYASPETLKVINTEDTFGKSEIVKFFNAVEKVKDNAKSLQAVRSAAKSAVTAAKNLSGSKAESRAPLKGRTREGVHHY